MQQCGGTVSHPHDWGAEHLHLVHSADYIRYLSSAYTRWQSLADAGKNPGIEVLPNSRIQGIDQIPGAVEVMFADGSGARAHETR